MGHDLLEDLRGAVVDGAHNTEPHAAGHAAPPPIASPGLAFEGLVALAGAAAGPCRQAKARRFARPPGCPGQGTTPEHGYIFIGQNDLTTTGTVFQDGECKRRPRQFSRVGS